MTTEDKAGGQPSREPTSNAADTRSAGVQIADLLPEPDGSPEPERKKKPEAKAAESDEGEDAPEPKVKEPEYDPLQGELGSGDDAEADEDAERKPEDEEGKEPVALADDSPIEWETKAGKHRATLAELKSGHMRDADYRQKTTALADERRTFEGERDTVRAKWHETFTAANAIVEAVVEELTSGVKKPDAALLNTDPDEFYRQKAQYDLAEERVSGILQKKADLIRQQQVEDHGKLVERARAEAAKLAEALPDFADAKKGPVLKAAIKSFAIKAGFSEDEISGVRDQHGRVIRPGLLDHRAILVLRDAMLYRAAVERQKTVKRKVSEAPTMPAGDGGPSRRERSEERTRALLKQARDSNSTREQGAAIAALLG